MAEDIAKAMKSVLETQQKWITTLLEDQRKWMENQKLIQATQYGKSVPAFPAFNKTQHTWDTFLSRLNQHFEAYAVETDSQKRAFFLSWMGAELYELTQKLFGSADVTLQSYSEIISKLTDHFKAKTHVLAARYEFNKTRMKEGQTYAEWVADLRGIARNCEYVCEKEVCKQSFVDALIRDMIVLHTPHDAVRSAALQKMNPTLNDVLTIAEAFEATCKTVKTIKGEQTADENQIQVINLKQKKHKNVNFHRNRKREIKSSTESGERKSCPTCGIDHLRSNCWHRKSRCHSCQKMGHISGVCMQKPTKKYRDTPPKSDYISSKQNIQTLEVFHVDNSLYTGTTESVQFLRRGKKIFVPVKINHSILEFQLDTGATCSMLGLDGYFQLGMPSCQPTDQILRAYGNYSVPVRGVIHAQIQWKSQQFKMPLLVTNVKGQNILGMDWVDMVKLPIEKIFQVSSFDNLKADANALIAKIFSKYKTIFNDDIGLCNMYKAKLNLKPNARPKFYKPRPIPFAQKDLVQAEINRLVSCGILKAIQSSQWASPIVIVNKPNGGVRICGDFKVTINSQLEIDQHPIPRIEELFHKLQNGQHFSKIDLSDAYFQLELDDDSKPLTTINTPFGLFRYERLPFGVASAPGIFQRAMEQIIAGMPSCAVYLDDIVVTGRNTEEHLQNLDELFSRFDKFGLRLNRNKCKFMENQVEYLGYQINAEGIHPTEKGVEAIKLLPRPKNLRELQAFLGKINYYNRFIPGFSEISAPLNKLRRKNVKFLWDREQEESFSELKQKVIKATCLVHFRDDYPLLLATDASAYGIGAVLLHRFPDGTERPIAHASKTLNAAQVNYSQIEKEALAIIFGVCKFHQYVYGRKFELITDHKPLITLFHPHKSLPVMTAQRIQRWAIVLMAYNYEIRYRSSERHGNADGLSRLPIGPDPDFDQTESACFEVDIQIETSLEKFPIDATVIASHTVKDNTLSQVLKLVKNGYNESQLNPTDKLKPYLRRFTSLTSKGNVLLLQTEHTRVIIPTYFRNRVLQLLHTGHWGVVKTKQLARRYCWWPNIDQDIAEMIKKCSACQSNSSSPKAEYTSWPEPQEAWERIHVDYAGPFHNNMFFICTDAYSNYPFAIKMNSTTSEATILALKKIFAVEGLPKTLVSDNGPQFSSSQFKSFCKENGIEHLKTAPFHPASNGEAERTVRTFKTAVAKICYSGANLDSALLEYLSTYRVLPNEKGKSPAELLHGRQPRIPLSLLVPQAEKFDERDEIINYKFHVGQEVYVKNYGRKGAPWIKGEVISHLGRRLYFISTEIGRLKRHQNQIKVGPNIDLNFHLLRGLARIPSSSQPQELAVSKDDDTVSPSEESQLPLRRSSRIRKPVQRYKP